MPADTRTIRLRALLDTFCVEYTDENPGVESPDPLLLRVRTAIETLITVAEAAESLAPDLSSSEDGSCTVCGEAVGHTNDCTAHWLHVALDGLSDGTCRAIGCDRTESCDAWDCPIAVGIAASPRRVPGRPAGQRIADDPTPEARELLGLSEAPCKSL